jgi:hypothetical protein
MCAMPLHNPYLNLGQSCNTNLASHFICKTCEIKIIFRLSFIEYDTAFFNIILYFEPWPVFVAICFIIDINLYSKIMKTVIVIHFLDIQF